MPTTEELIYELDFDWDEASFESFESSLSSAISTFAKITAAAVVGAGAIFGVTKAAADYGDELAKTSLRLNTTTEDLQRLDFVARQNGATYEELTSSLNSLSKAQFDVLRGKGDFEAWGKIGINPADYEDTADLLLAIADGVKDIETTAEKINIIESLGLSRNMIQLLNSGSEGIKRLSDEFDRFGITATKQQTEMAEEFADTWDKSTTMMSGVMKQVGFELMETVLPIINQFNDFLKNNMKNFKKGMAGAFKAIQQISTVVLSLVQRIGIQFDRLVGILGGTEKAIYSLIGVMAIFKARSIAAMLPAIAVATGIYLAFDELFSFLEGEESFLGDFLGIFGIASSDVAKLITDFPIMEVAIGAIAIATIGLGNALKIVRFALMAIAKTPLGRILSVIGLIAWAAYESRDSLKELIGTLGEWISNTLDNIKLLVDDVIKYFDPLFKMFESIKEFASSTFGNISGLTNDVVNSVTNLFTPEQQNPTNNTVTNNANNVSININAPGGDPETIRRELDSYFSQKLTNIGGN